MPLPAPHRPRFTTSWAASLTGSARRPRPSGRLRRENGEDAGESPLPIFLPQTQLAKILGCRQATVSSVLMLLALHGVFKEVNPRGSYSQKKAKEYEFWCDPRTYRRPAAAS